MEYVEISPGKNQLEILRKMIATKEGRFWEYCPRWSGFDKKKKLKKEKNRCVKTANIDQRKEANQV